MGYSEGVLSLLEETAQLAEKFQNSDIYLDYCRSKELLKNDTTMLDRLKEYKKIQHELEIKRLQEGTISFDEEKRLAHLYSELSLHPIAGSFLAAEHELLQLYRKALDSLSEACDMEF